MAEAACPALQRHVTLLASLSAPSGHAEHVDLPS